jgi:hypothetical protein
VTNPISQLQHTNSNETQSINQLTLADLPTHPYFFLPINLLELKVNYDKHAFSFSAILPTL